MPEFFKRRFDVRLSGSASAAVRLTATSAMDISAVVNLEERDVAVTAFQAMTFRGLLSPGGVDVKFLEPARS